MVFNQFKRLFCVFLGFGVTTSSHATAEHGHKMAGVSVEDVDGLRRQIPLSMSTLKQTTKLSFVDDTVHL